MLTHLGRMLFAAIAAVGLMTGCGSTPGVPEPSASQASGSPAATGEPLELVFLSDSSGWQVADLYAARITETLGRPVHVTDFAVGGLTAVEALDLVKMNPGKFAEAEVIVVGGSAADAGPVGADVGTCVSLEPGSKAPKVYAVSDWKDFRAQLDAIYTEIWKVRDGAPVILRTMDVYVPVLTEMRALNIEKECTADWTSMSGAIREAAVANGATMVSVYDVFNGPDHLADPRDKGYIGPDGTHTSAEGAAVIADTLASAGYALNTPPPAQ